MTNHRGLDQSLVFSQSPLNSTGHAVLAEAFWKKKDKPSMKKLMPKTHSFFSESQMSCGNSPRNPARLAPNPNSTRVDGSAQQRSVPKEVKRDR